ncbi:hypothetical protein LSH36_107g05111 [Paralvinella palmiformis]|uniref:Methyltransferase FkbM domain-containing protein n=1 Tax=Paralvinella palmiformis TaxID=53620 RepID=A0AAD9N9E0_9ANNE|nr:hypothetical protein LSH36_107g05111 [Paralvinella palmiformis]
MSAINRGTVFAILALLVLSSTFFFDKNQRGHNFSLTTGVHIWPTKRINNSCHQELSRPNEWSPPTIPVALRSVPQDDPELVKHICEQWLLPPASSGERNLRHPEQEHYSQRDQSQFVDELLKRKTNGFYIESGAANGEQLSNSLFFEKSRNWSGLLVEANPASFRSMLATRRRAYMVNACLSPRTIPATMSFRVANLIGGLTDYMEAAHKSRIDSLMANDTDTIQVQCIPLYSILKAIGVTFVDYFSLDIEGAELDVLYTLPLDKITVDVFSIEYYIPHDDNATNSRLEAIKRHLVEGHGYKIVRIGFGEDVILRKY